MPKETRRGAYREVNESIRRLAVGGAELDTWDFFCECEDVACHVLVSLTLDEYDARRATAPTVPILAAHHAAAA